MRCEAVLAAALVASAAAEPAMRRPAGVAFIHRHPFRATQPTFNAKVTRIVLDVVVRGRDHKPIPDLEAKDFEVLEDGRARPLSSFEEVRMPASIAGPRTNVGPELQAGVPASVDVPTVAVIFEELGPEARRLARQAAVSLVNGASPIRAGVFVLRNGLEQVHPLTLDRDALRRAIDAAAERPGCPVFESHLGHRQAQMTACSPAGESQMHRQRGVNTFAGLTAVVDALAGFRGRKSVALFSEGLDLTSGARGQFGDDRRSRFEALIARASEANVAFYTFDAAGLRLHTTATGQLMEEPRAGLSLLARETGGAFADGSNGLRPAVARMWADMQHYYLLSFDSDRDVTGSSVRVRVRVKVRGATVLVRDRYGRAPAGAQPGSVP
ncbi:hypothetical protein TBR22_A24680 [Luteitalea sp. TBR-22]|nr:hypothetical protein TBR22_A24680 [Luteitalea sp. TBR-22]